MDGFQIERTVAVLEEVNPRKRGFLGIFSMIDWGLVIKIVLEILRRLGYLDSTVMAAPLPPDVSRAIDKKFPA